MPLTQLDPGQGILSFKSKFKKSGVSRVRKQSRSQGGLETSDTASTALRED